MWTAEKRPPIGLGFLISALRQRGHRVYFVDGFLNPSNVLETDFLTRHGIDVVGISANSICFPNTLKAFDTLQRMRERGTWKGRIAVGGPHTAVATETIPEYVDHVIIGEGEITFPDVVENPPSERIIRGEKVEDLDVLPMPAWDEFIHRPYDWSHDWANQTPVYTFNTSRGCPFSCTFCSVKGVWGKTYRMMSAERVLNDLEFMQRHYGLRTAYFREDHFTLNKRRTRAICEGLLNQGLDIDWMCETRADNIDDPELITLMGRAGCRALYIGVESGSPRMLKMYKKGETVEQFERVFQRAREAGIKTYASLIFGAPGETPEDIGQTWDMIKRIRPDYVGKNVFVAIPGSELYQQVRDEHLGAYQTVGGIIYLKGHDRRVDVYYGGRPEMKIPTTNPVTRAVRSARFHTREYWQNVKRRHPFVKRCANSRYANWIGKLIVGRKAGFAP